MTAYYNEHDPHAAQWLRNLIAAGHIAPGDVDEGSIVDVRGTDLAGYTQCHFFAGIGVWSHALRQAGWPDDRPVWTGSCPCQSFSAAGSGGGFNDERHLWPDWFRLIGECQPRTVFGEQVASRDGLAWLDFVCADMEGANYAIAAIDTCAAGFGAPHVRQRIYFVAAADNVGSRRRRAGEAIPESSAVERFGRLRDSGELANPEIGRSGALDRQSGSGIGRQEQTGGHSLSGELANPDGRHPGTERQQRGGQQRLLAQVCGAGGVEHAIEPRLERHSGHGDNGNRPGRLGTIEARSIAAPSATNGFWRYADWLPCRDGKARPVEPGTLPLAHGAAARVGRLRAYGNGLCAPQAAEFIRAFLDLKPYRN